MERESEALLRPWPKRSTRALRNPTSDGAQAPRPDAATEADGDQRDGAAAAVLDAERLASEQVRYHFISRQLVQTWVTGRTKPSYQLAALSQRLHVA